MSEPTSPLLMQAPKWLRQTSRTVWSARYVLKLVLLGSVCILLGVSVSSLYESNSLQRILESDEPRPSGENAPYLRELRTNPYYHEIDLTSDKSFSKEVSSQKSMLQRLKHKVQALNPWGSITDTLTCNTSPSNNITAQEPGNTNGSIHELITTPLDPISPPILAKVTIVTGNPVQAYERALRTHDAHNRLHDYSMLTLRQNIMPDVWSKPSYILSCILRELAKPPHERLQWLFWVDVDTIIINPYVPLETFLPPPTKDFEDIHLLVTHDWNGLNNGVFPIRVCEWSVELLSTVLAYPHFKPDEFLQFRDQSAMANILKWPHFKRHTLQVPQRWYNAYQGEIEETIAEFQTRPGDLLVHFAGVIPREERMEWWLARAEQHLPEWEVDFKHTTVKADVSNWFDKELEARKTRKEEVLALRTEWNRRRRVLRDYVEHWKDRDLFEVNKNRIVDGLEAVEKLMQNDDFADQPKALEPKMTNEDRFKPVQRLIEEATKDRVLEAKEVLSDVQINLANVDVSDYGSQDAQEYMDRLAYITKRLQWILKSKIMTKEEIDENLAELAEVQQEVKSLLTGYSGAAWDWPANTAKSEKDLERQRLRDEISKEMEAELDRETEAQAAAEAGPPPGEETDADLKKPSLQAEELDDADSSGDPFETSTDEEADRNQRAQNRRKKSRKGGKKHKSQDANETSGGGSSTDPQTDANEETAQPTKAEAIEVPNREQWWQEEGQFSESALTELQEEAATKAETNAEDADEASTRKTAVKKEKKVVGGLDEYGVDELAKEKGDGKGSADESGKGTGVDGPRLRDGDSRLVSHR